MVVQITLGVSLVTCKDAYLLTVTASSRLNDDGIMSLYVVLRVILVMKKCCHGVIDASWCDLFCRCLIPFSVAVIDHQRLNLFIKEISFFRFMDLASGKSKTLVLGRTFVLFRM